MESYGKGDEICVSGGTASKVSKKAFGLVRKGAFVPKGKRKEVTIYKCRWKQYPSLIDGIKEGGVLPVVMRQKFEIFVYSLASLGILYQKSGLNTPPVRVGMKALVPKARQI